MVGAYLASEGPAAKPLTYDSEGRKFWVGAVATGLLAPALLRAAESKLRPGRGARSLTMLGSILTRGGALMLKIAIKYAGRTLAADPEATRYTTPSEDSAPAWPPASPGDASHG